MIKFNKCIVLISAFFVLHFGLVSLTNAQGILLDPNDLNFGEVGLGELSLLNLMVYPTEPIPLTIEYTIVEDDSSAAFFIDEYLLHGIDGIEYRPGVPPSVLLYSDTHSTGPGVYNSLELIVGFSPLSPGLHTGSIKILSDAEPPDRILYSQLSGTGAGQQPIPEPASIFLIGFGLVALAGLGRKKFFKA